MPKPAQTASTRSLVMAERTFPTLVDELFHATYRPQKSVSNVWFEPEGTRRTATALRAALISTERYFIDPEATRACARLGVQHPDILQAMLPRARLPFPKVWVEWDNTIVLDELDAPRADQPHQSGVFIEEIGPPDSYPIYRMTAINMARVDNGTIAQPSVTSVVYSLDQPIIERMPSLLGVRSDLARLAETSKEVMDVCLLGSGYNSAALSRDIPADVENRLDIVEHRLTLCRNLAAHASHTFSPFWPNYQQMCALPSRQYLACQHAVQNDLLETAGTWRFVMAVLAMIQQRDYTSQLRPPANPARRRFVGNKVVPYLQHWRVSLKLPRAVILRQMIESTREALPRARHAVEGHWKTHRVKGDPYCDHVDVAETPTRYRCALCGRASWFQPSHMRGSALVGHVKKDRVVQRRGERQ